MIRSNFAYHKNETNENLRIEFLIIYLFSLLKHSVIMYCIIQYCYHETKKYSTGNCL